MVDDTYIRLSMIGQWSEACPTGAYTIFRGWRNILIRGGKFCPSSKIFLPYGKRDKRGAEYLIITKERLVLVSAPIPQWELFHQGQKHTILNLIRGILRGGYMSPRIIHQWHMPLMPHAFVSCLENLRKKVLKRRTSFFLFI